MQDIIDKSKYSDKKYAIPYNKNLSKSDKKYFLDWQEAIYSYWIRGLTGITATDTETFRHLRKFGSGQQDEEIYKNLLMGKPSVDDPTSHIETDVDTGVNANRDTKRRGFMNLLWDILSPADKLMAALIGKLSKMNTVVSVDCMDEASKDEEEYRKFELLRYMEAKEFEDQYRWMAGIPQEKPDYLPSNRDELDIYAEEGGFKLPFAMAMEDFCNVTEEVSSFDEIKDQLYADFININVTGIYPYFDEGSKRIMFRYLDPELAVIQDSKYPDFRDSEYGGNWEFVPLSELIQKGVITDPEEIRGMMSKYSGKLNNPTLSELSMQPGTDFDQTSLEDSFKVLVFRAWWIDNDIKKDLVHTNKKGEKRVREYVEDEKVGSKEHVRETLMRKLYTSNWIVGTEYCYDYGVFKDMVRKNRNDVNFPQFMYKGRGRPLTKQVIPLYNSLQLNWLKYQDAVATAKKAGYVIDYNAIVNMKQGGGKNPEKEVIRRLIQTGIIVVKATNIGGRPNVFQKPVEVLQGGLGNQLTEFITSFEFNTRMIETYTGINPITLGSAPNNDALVGTTEISVAGTDNILQNMINGVSRIQQKAHDYAVDWIQILFKHNPEVRKVYSGMIGKDSVAAIMAAMKDNVAYGAFITMGITAEEEAKLLQSAEISLQNGRDGKPGINEADYAYIIRLLKSKSSIKRIYLVLDQRIKRSVKESQQAAMQAATADREAQAKNDQEKAAREAEMAKVEHDRKLEIIRLEGEEERKTVVLKAQVEPKKETVPQG